LKILVTGGAGFIGSHLVEKLVSEGHEVWIIDDLSAGKREYLSHLFEKPQVHFIEGSVLNRALLQPVIAEVDLIYHLAAVLGVKNCVDNPLYVIEGNIDGTKHVLEYSYQHQKKVVFASTSEVYGKNDRLPFKEEDDRILGSTSTNRWCYATAKALDEHLCFAYAKMGLEMTIVRYFNTYGPRAVNTAYGGVIPRFITAALRNEPLQVYGTGEQLRCFTYIEDTIEATYRAKESKANGMVINIGNNQPISILALAHLIRELTNSSSQIILLPYEKAYGKGYEDMMKREPDITRLQEVLNYTPKVTLQEGLLKTIEWYKAYLIDQGEKLA
jgi:UDP-glucose 4-epimerase